MNHLRLFKRSYHNFPMTAFNMLNNVKTKAINNLKSNIYATEDMDCHQCLKIIRKHKIDYLPIKSNNNIIGVLSKHEIQKTVMIHELDEEESKFNIINH